MLEYGSVLHIDLSSLTITTTLVEEALVRKYFGGRGFNAAMGIRMLPADREALSPDNPLLISTGLLTGTSAPFTSRTHFNAVSPQTGIWGSSSMGGFLGPALRSLHIQTLIITGRADRPVYLYMSPQKMEFLPADDLWGLDAWDTEERIKDIWDNPKLRVMTIGPAGENRSGMAVISVGRHSVAGRTGLGAVMGSKNFKALVVEPAKTPPSTTSPEEKEAGLAFIKRAQSMPWFSTIARYGQSSFIKWTDEMGMLATRNYQQGTFEGSADICGSNMEPIIYKNQSCARCAVHCKADLKVDGDIKPRPELESLAALGAKCGQRNQKAIIELNALCGRYGMDTISVGSTMAFAMDLYEKGLIDPETTDGLKMEWGDFDAQAELLRQMAHREGFGAVFADGVRAAAQRLGGEAHRYAFHVKGLEMCSFDPRGVQSTALAYAIGERGADFAWAFATPEFRWSPEKALAEVGIPEAADRFSPKGKPEVVKMCSSASAVEDSLGLCKVPTLVLPAEFNLEFETHLVNAFTGWNMTREDLGEVGRRIINLERLINLTLTNGKLQDTLPERFLTETLSEGPVQGRLVALEEMRHRYYDLMGWDENGRPLAATLTALGIDV